MLIKLGIHFCLHSLQGRSSDCWLLWLWDDLCETHWCLLNDWFWWYWLHNWSSWNKWCLKTLQLVISCSHYYFGCLQGCFLIILLIISIFSFHVISCNNHPSLFLNLLLFHVFLFFDLFGCSVQDTLVFKIRSMSMSNGRGISSRATKEKCQYYWENLFHIY